MAVVVAWSGGVDSTALIGALLKSRRDVLAICLPIYKESAPRMWQREYEARQRLKPVLEDIAKAFGASFRVSEHQECEWIWAFARHDDPAEIPTRNKRIVDFIVAGYLWGEERPELGLGEYIGVDTWVVQDHVDGLDCDTRSLAAYLFNEYGITYRLWTLEDFGRMRYKRDRVKLLVESIGPKAAGFTTNCLNDTENHCGRCYKCIERRAAFEMTAYPDATVYDRNPTDDSRYAQYLQQMAGPR
jgi:hypothetical protein